MKARRVKVFNTDGLLVRICETVNDAAAYVGISTPSVRRSIKEGRVYEGMWFEYEKTEYREGLKKKGNHRREMRLKEGREFEVGDLDSLAEVEAVEASYAKKHITLERVGYELRFGRVAVTLCRKRDVGVRPTIGSVGCERCTYFRGRCKSERIVLCAHRSYNTSERLLHGKHKEE